MLCWVGRVDSYAVILKVCLDMAAAAHLSYTMLLYLLYSLLLCLTLCYHACSVAGHDRAGSTEHQVSSRGHGMFCSNF